MIREDGPRDGELISSICYSPTGDLVAFGQMVNFGVFGDHSRPIYIWNIIQSIIYTFNTLSGFTICKYIGLSLSKL